MKCFLDQLNYNELTCIVDNDGNSELIKQLQNPTEIDIRESFKKLLFACFNLLVWVRGSKVSIQSLFWCYEI